MARVLKKAIVNSNGCITGLELNQWPVPWQAHPNYCWSKVTALAVHIPDGPGLLTYVEAEFTADHDSSIKTIVQYFNIDTLEYEVVP